MTLIIETEWFRYFGPITEKTPRIVRNLLKVIEEEEIAENIRLWFFRHRGHRAE